MTWPDSKVSSLPHGVRRPGCPRRGPTPLRARRGRQSPVLRHHHPAEVVGQLREQRLERRHRLDRRLSASRSRRSGVGATETSATGACGTSCVSATTGGPAGADGTWAPAAGRASTTENHRREEGPRHTRRHHERSHTFLSAEQGGWFAAPRQRGSVRQPLEPHEAPRTAGPPEMEGDGTLPFG